MAFTFPATVTDTDDAIAKVINSAVNTAVAPLQTKVNNLQAEVDALKARVTSLENK